MLKIILLFYITLVITSCGQGIVTPNSHKNINENNKLNNDQQNIINNQINSNTEKNSSNSNGTNNQSNVNNSNNNNNTGNSLNNNILNTNNNSTVLPDTGQTKCYDNTSEIDCPTANDDFYGQDGSYIINEPSFLDNEDGTITDNNTGLMWKKCISGIQGASCTEGVMEELNLENAKQACSDLNTSPDAPYTNWRIPNIEELISILDLSRSNPSINSTFFPNNPFDWFWSTTKKTSDLSCVWGVEYGFSGLYDDYSTESGSWIITRCVRNLNEDNIYLNNS